MNIENLRAYLEFEAENLMRVSTLNWKYLMYKDILSFIRNASSLATLIFIMAVEFKLHKTERLKIIQDHVNLDELLNSSNEKYRELGIEILENIF